MQELSRSLWLHLIDMLWSACSRTFALGAYKWDLCLASWVLSWAIIEFEHLCPLYVLTSVNVTIPTIVDTMLLGIIRQGSRLVNEGHWSRAEGPNSTPGWVGTTCQQLMNNIPADYQGGGASRFGFGCTLDIEICEGLSKPSIYCWNIGR